MEFQFLPAVIAGLVAGVIMEMPVYLQKAVGLDVKQDIFRTWGAMFKLHGAPMYVVGFLFHEVLSAAIALIYALGFQLVGADGNLWLWGLVGGVVHYLIAGLVIGAMPAMHPEIPDRIAPQGAYYKKYGALDVASFMTGHLTFGVLVGIFYGYLTGGIQAAF